MRSILNIKPRFTKGEITLKNILKGIICVMLIIAFIWYIIWYNDVIPISYLIRHAILGESDVVKCFTPVFVNPGETLDEIYDNICGSYEHTLEYDKIEWIKEVEYINPVNNGLNYDLTTIVVPFLEEEKNIYTDYECGYYIPF